VQDAVFAEHLPGFQQSTFFPSVVCWQSFYKTSNNPAAPMPPPTHIVHTTNFAPLRLPSVSACPTILAPDMP